MIRDLILLSALCLVFALTVRAPFIGLLAWIWVSLMNPHQEVHGFLRGAQLNLCIAVVTVAAWLASREPKRVPPNLFIGLLALFSLWIWITTTFALDPPHAYPLFNRTIKTVVLAVAVIMLANSRLRLQAVLWVMVLSIGYFGVKGGGFVLLTGGHNHVFGPENSMIEDNNALGLALIVLLPLMFYLRGTSARALVRWGLLGVIALTLVAVFGTYSRGALIALAASTAVYAVRSKYGVIMAAVAVLSAAALPSIMPPSWFQRMSTIQSADHDTSFQERVSAWRTSVAIAKARPLIGGGFSAVEQTWIAQTYHTPGSLDHGRAAHSVYFQVLGDNGFAGLGIYLAVVAAAVMNTFRVLGLARGQRDFAWAAKLARMLQVCLAGFLAGGAALSMAYYDGIILLFALTAALLETVRVPAAARAAAAEPRWKQTPKRRDYRLTGRRPAFAARLAASKRAGIRKGQTAWSQDRSSCSSSTSCAPISWPSG
jgi:probable O-glycosylation ligase (exosortase A-associated)